MSNNRVMLVRPFEMTDRPSDNLPLPSITEDEPEMPGLEPAQEGDRDQPIDLTEEPVKDEPKAEPDIGTRRSPIDLAAPDAPIVFN